MTTKNDAKFEEELTCRFEIDMRNLMNLENIEKLLRSRILDFLLFHIKGNHK